MAAVLFEYSHRVTYADCTIGNHVYYSRFLDIMEAARGELFRSRGAPLSEWQTRDVALPVFECSVRYKAQATYDDLLTVRITVSLAVGTRVHFDYEVFNQRSELLISAQTCHACVSLSGKVKRLPSELLNLFTAAA